ncbi:MULTISPECIES: 6-carboxytetrahydropterin synthase [Paenibacillus]|uniref:6-pyruvoyl trahydropterin synthase family protein n=1 Tax=Paenibacillus TaxID=44249 RepID=UPI00040A2D94|nr:6-carboxytetrahydropterin synthase [Paenibacillus humicus]
MQTLYPSPPHSFRYELHKEFHFAAAHYIPAEEAGSCSRVHGHTYYADVTVAGDKLDGCGFLVNFSEVKRLVRDRFDHRLLNDDERFGSEAADDPETFPTTEVVARTVWQLVQEELDRRGNGARCLQVFLRETPSSYVIYRPEAVR